MKISFDFGFWIADFGLTPNPVISGFVGFVGFRFDGLKPILHFFGKSYID